MGVGEADDRPHSGRKTGCGLWWSVLAPRRLRQLPQKPRQRLARAKRGGSIVNIASMLGLRVGIGNSHYCTAKAGVVQLTKSLALELAR